MKGEEGYPVLEGQRVGDREVSWPGRAEGRTAHMHHLHTLPFTPCPLADDFSALDNPPPSLAILPLSLTELSTVSFRRISTLFYHHLRTINHQEEWYQLYQYSSAEHASKPCQGWAGPLTPSIPMWALVDGSQGATLPEETKETL